eukprot:7519725-Pyramimonas_sp.AAC.1
MAYDTPRCLKMAPTMPQEASRPPQDGSKWPTSSESPKTGPRAPIRPQGRPRTPQERSKRGPRGECWGSRGGGGLIKDPPSLVDLPQEGPKTAQTGAQCGGRERTAPEDGDQYSLHAPAQAPRNPREGQQRPSKH